MYIHTCDHLEVNARMHTSDRHKKPLCSPSRTRFPQLLGNKRLAEPVVEAVEVQQGCRMAARRGYEARGIASAPDTEHKRGFHQVC